MEVKIWELYRKNIYDSILIFCISVSYLMK